MPQIRAAVRDLVHLVFSRSPLAWGQVLFLWVAGVMIGGPAAYVAYWLETHRRGWVHLHWVAGPQGDHVLSPIAGDQLRAALGLAAEIALAACIVAVIIFLLGRSIYATATPYREGAGDRRRGPPSVR